MKTWILDKEAATLTLHDLPAPAVRPGAVLVRMEAVPLLSYTRDYVAGKLPYAYPQGPFTPGTNGIGRVVEVGAGVQHFHAGQRVALNPYWLTGENVAEPAQILIGLTGISADSSGMLAEYPNGTLREIVDMPASTLVPLEGLDDIPAGRLATLAKFIVPFGGLRRVRVAAGDTVAINGAGGYFGSAAVLAALAMGATRVLAVARRASALQGLVELGKGRVVPVVLSGDVEADVAAMRSLSGGGVAAALDMVGQASSADSTLTVLRSLRRGGRLAVMGSMLVPLPLPYGEMMLNNWELVGNFMYRPDDYRALTALVESGQLSLDAVDLRSFALEDIEAAIDHAAGMQGLQATVVHMGS
ncbi:Zn-dependent alcohol dehydrogenase [Herbaspirillum sp. CF444]|uniref:zinc-binding dehydrogenase n=1 Tax=Herbaspirillum sp. CF444 TaxID=1144319 RepID=UPI0002727945|nr:zinc-binding dehydrogenase [Herbaspirillum sp. CF444]EJL87930.1 Zn-dependent alcohol dehydrogenase [Herbaspirillum sp. CF444]